MRTALITTALLLMLALAGPANALCSYNGKLYATTTVAQEFHDSKWVMRAKLVAAENHWSDAKNDPWTLYHVETLEIFKGHAPKRLNVFTFRDSGGFYLDKGMSHNLGGEYLLFLIPETQTLPHAARGAFQVNYSCGQSAAWAEITPPQKRALLALSLKN